MGKAILDISMSLDGFITGPNDNHEQPLGEGGDQLHQLKLLALCIFGSASSSDHQWRIL